MIEVYAMAHINGELVGQAWGRGKTQGHAMCNARRTVAAEFGLLYSHVHLVGLQVQEYHDKHTGRPRPENKAAQRGDITQPRRAFQNTEV